MEGERHTRAGGQDVGRSRGLRELTACRKVVGVDVGVDDVLDPHPGFVGGAQVGAGIANRIDHGPACLAATAEQVGDADGVLVQELP